MRRRYDTNGACRYGKRHGPCRSSRLCCCQCLVCGCDYGSDHLLLLLLLSLLLQLLLLLLLLLLALL